jgi:ribosome-binding factor A
VRPERDGPTPRHERLAQLLKDELRGLFRDDVEDPALFGVEIAAVVLSVDYKHLRVHYTFQGGAQQRALAARLERVTPFLRARLADAIDLKSVPALAFVRDA